MTPITAPFNANVENLCRLKLSELRALRRDRRRRFCIDIVYYIVMKAIRIDHKKLVKIVIFIATLMLIVTSVLPLIMYAL